MYVFEVSNRDTLAFDDYVVRNLDSVQTDEGSIRSGQYSWTPSIGGLVLGILSGS